MTHTKTIELPDDIRVPLHELQADLAYLIGLLVIDSTRGAIIEASVRGKLDAIEKAIYRALEDAA